MRAHVYAPMEARKVVSDPLDLEVLALVRPLVGTGPSLLPNVHSASSGVFPVLVPVSESFCLL